MSFQERPLRRPNRTRPIHPIVDAELRAWEAASDEVWLQENAEADDYQPMLTGESAKHFEERSKDFTPRGLTEMLVKIDDALGQALFS